MMQLNKTSGIKLYPDFLEKLIVSREQSLVGDISVVEWEVRRLAALLGLDSPAQIAGYIGANITFLTAVSDLRVVIEQQKVMTENERDLLKRFLSSLQATDSQSASSGGLFAAQRQMQLQDVFVGGKRDLGSVGSQAAYDEAVNMLVTMTGRLRRSYPSYEEARVGAAKNGVSTPASDVAGLVDRIAVLLSQRSKLLKALEGVLQQNTELTQMSSDGGLSVGLSSSLSDTGFDAKLMPTGMFDRLVEDDDKHVLGHKSSKRFVIGDEDLYGYTFTDNPPSATHYSVAGTDALVGESGGKIAGGFPLYLAFGVDFDLWRQYGFRSEKPVEKPFLWDAEKQCAPYAMMLLTRERKNMVRVSANVKGNEFYQLGDVAYMTDLQQLFYAYTVSHNISYEGSFGTTLDLRYGRSPGEYIPTPLDIIGKSLSNKNNKQGAFRVRRQRQKNDTLLGTIKFPNGQSDISALLGGRHGKRNLATLSNASLQAKSAIDMSNMSSSPRLVIMTFGSNSNKSIQGQRASAVAGWFSNPKIGRAHV